MCGRYTIKDPQAFAAVLQRLGYLPKHLRFPPRFNVAPTQVMPVVSRDGLLSLPWKFVPFYERQNPSPKMLVNARSETLLSKSAFRSSAQKRRIVVPADGFYEWKREDGKSKQAYHFKLRDSAAFVVAGIVDTDTPEDAPGYCLLTTAPNELMAPIHDRMPAILTSEKAKAWLSSEEFTQEKINELCASFPADQMEALPVSSYVNNARHEGPECIRIERAADQLELL